jgi:hypothetical protein
MIVSNARACSVTVAAGVLLACAGSVQRYGNTAYINGQTTYYTGGMATKAIRDKVTKAAVIKWAD